MIPVLSPARQQAMSSHTRSDRRDILSAASVVSDYFPSKITIKKPGPVWKDVLSFGPLQCYMATFPPSSGGSQCRQRVTGRSGLFWPAFWRVERRKFPRRIGHDSATVDGRDPAPGAQCPMRVSIADWQVIKKGFCNVLG